MGVSGRLSRRISTSMPPSSWLVTEGAAVDNSVCMFEANWASSLWALRSSASSASVKGILKLGLKAVLKGAETEEKMPARPQNWTRRDMSFGPGLEPLTAPLAGALDARACLNPRSYTCLCLLYAGVHLNCMFDDIAMTRAPLIAFRTVVAAISLSHCCGKGFGLLLPG